MSLTDDPRYDYVPGVALEVSIPELMLPQMAEEAARRYPQRAILDFFSRSIIYAQLVDRVRRATSVLACAGAAPGDRVTLMISNCPQHVIAILTTMILGGIVTEHNLLSLVLETEKEFETHGARVVIAWEKSIDKLTFLKDEATIFSANLIRAMLGATQLLLHLPAKTTKGEHAALSAKPPTWARSWDCEVM